MTRYLNAKKFQEIHNVQSITKSQQSDNVNELSTASKQQLAKVTLSYGIFMEILALISLWKYISLQIMIHILLKMVFIDNFVHGDLHPGNILIHESTNHRSSKEEHVMSIWKSYNKFLEYSFSPLDVLDHWASLVRKS